MASQCKGHAKHNFRRRVCVNCKIPEQGTFERWIRDFWLKVEKTDTCWNWIGCMNHDGYGQYVFKPPFIARAHRISWMLHGNQIPDGMQLDHLCRNRRCINPAHLEVVTHKENHRRRRLLVCKRGHPQTEENRYKIPNTNRERCKPCIKVQAHERLGRIS